MPQKRGLGSGIDVLIPKAQGTKKGEEKKKAYLRDTGLRPHYTRRKAKGDAARNEQAKS